MAKLPGDLWQAYPLLVPQLDVPRLRPEVVLRLCLIQRLDSDSLSQFQKIVLPYGNQLTSSGHVAANRIERECPAYRPVRRAIGHGLRI